MSDTIAGMDDEHAPLRYSGVVNRLTVLREYAIVVSTVVLFLVLTFTSDVFFTKLNLLNILEQQAPVGIVAFALTLVIISGEFDLAAGAVFVLTGIVATRLHAELGTYPALLIGIAVATACGAVNGLLVAYVKVNSFVCTLATSIIVFGVTLAVTKGKLITITESSYGTLGGSKLFGVKYSIWILLIVGLLCGFVLSRTKFGRRLFAVGGNPEAARLSGINVRGIKLTAFVISGLAAGIGGAILSSRTAVGQPDNGIRIVFGAFAAVVVGGTSAAGGRGAIWRTALGLLFLALITNGFNLLGVDIYYQQIIQGLIILLAVSVDSLTRTSQ